MMNLAVGSFKLEGSIPSGAKTLCLPSSPNPESHMKGEGELGLSCSTFNLHILGARVAHPTRNVQFQIMQNRCGLA